VSAQSPQPIYFQSNGSSKSCYELISYLKILIHTIVILFATAATSRVSAQTCTDVPASGTESMSATITINGTNIQVTDGMWVPRGTILRIDSVAQAFGSCTGMGWTNTTPSTCEPTGFVWQRAPSHTYVTVDIGALNGSYAVGNVWGLFPDMHVLDTHSADTTGPNQLWLYWTGSYRFHIYANINTTPCSLMPDATEEKIITVYAGDDDGATDFSDTSCNSNLGKPVNSVGEPVSSVGEPVNVTNGNVYLQQTDYRLPGVGARGPRDYAHF
jgi:hypothetical protein